jgi:hypothetical protein
MATTMFRKLFVLLSIAFFFNNLYSQEPVKRDVVSFTKLEVGEKIIVRLVKAEKESMLIAAQGVDASAVKTDISGNTLKISIYGESFTRKKVIVTLGYTKLTSIAVSGGADVTNNSILKTDSLLVDLKSGAMMNLELDVKFLQGKILEGGTFTASGYADVQDIIVATSGTLSAFELESENIKVKASSSGKAKINVENELNAEVASKGYISYKGNPKKVNKIVNSGGIITPYQP